MTIKQIQKELEANKNMLFQIDEQIQGLRDQIRELQRKEIETQDKIKSQKYDISAAIKYARTIEDTIQVDPFIFSQSSDAFMDMYPDILVFAHAVVSEVRPDFEKFAASYMADVIEYPYLHKPLMGKPTWSAKIKIGTYTYFCHCYGGQWKKLGVVKFEERMAKVEQSKGLKIHANKKPIELPHQFPTDDD